jgi:hypothetical protein
MPRKYFKWLSADLYAFLVTLKKWYNTALGVGTVTTGIIIDNAGVNIVDLIQPKILVLISGFFLFLGLFLEGYKKDNFDE